jgi:hypothetical protein
MPTSTDLVTDLPADFNVFGQGVDTSMQDLLGGTTGQVLSKASNANMDFTWVAQDDSNAIQNSIVDAKGDLIAATANDTPARLAVGANDTVLTADSTAATGMKWAAPAAGGGLTLLSTTALTGSSVTVSSISGSYKNLQIVLKNIYQSANDDGVFLRLNGDTGTKYQFGNYRIVNTTLSAQTNTADDRIENFLATSTTAATASRMGTAVLNLYRYTDTDIVQGDWVAVAASNADVVAATTGQFSYDCTAAISSVTFATYTGTFSGGTIYIYGVN